jgi:hypothetical protein
MPIVKIMYWKDIPCSVRVEEGRRNRVTRKLPDIYMQVVDAVAMKEGTVGSDDYQAAFRWGEPEERSGAPEAIADAVVEEILARYPRAWLIDRGKRAGVSEGEIV